MYVFHTLGVGCATVIYPDAAALLAAHILAQGSTSIWAQIKAKQLNAFVSLKKADKDL